MFEAPIQSCATCCLPSEGSCPFVQRRVKAGQVFWLQGDVPPEVCLVREGIVSLSSAASTGTETLSAVRGPRTVLGVEALDAKASSVSVEALTDVVVCAAEPSAVQGWMGPPSSPAMAFLRLALGELERRARDMDLRSGPSLARVARFLSAYARLIEAGRHTPFSKQHVARLLGMRAETLSRCLRQLVDERLIESGRHVAVLEAERLDQLARCASP